MLPEAFWNRVKKTSTCWLWTGHIAKGKRQGYGRYGKRDAHRLLYKDIFGPLDSRVELHHICENKSCVNPEHLQRVTSKTHPGNGPWVNRNKTHCKRGHEYTDANVRIEVDKHGWVRRHCLACERVK